MDELWWNQVPNALRLINHIINELQNNKNIVLALPKYIPWYYTFREKIDLLKLQVLSNYVIKYIDDNEELHPGEISLKCFCKKELRDDYRPAIGYARFLAETNNTLKNSIAWIKVSSIERANEWIDFATEYSKYKKKEYDGGLIIIETEENERIVSSKGVSVISYSSYIGEFDYFIFNILGSSVLELSKDTKEYYAEILTSIVESDIELAAMCFDNRRYKDFLIKPIQTIRSIIECESRSDGVSFELKKDQNQIEMDIWKAQIKNLFPKIEAFREDFVKKYFEEIENKLPIVAAYGEQYTIPEEVELGTLYYLANNNMINISRADSNKLKCFKNARNKLAHLCFLSYDEVSELLSNL